VRFIRVNLPARGVAEVEAADGTAPDSRAAPCCLAEGSMTINRFIHGGRFVFQVKYSLKYSLTLFLQIFDPGLTTPPPDSGKLAA
jgi:hypothetical protein